MATSYAPLVTNGRKATLLLYLRLQMTAGVLRVFGLPDQNDSRSLLDSVATKRYISLNR